MDHKVPRSLIETIKQKITRHDVVIFSKSYCPYCKAAKALFQTLRVPFVSVELDQMGSVGQKVQEALKVMTGQSTVPSVFIGGKHYGGNSDVQKMHDEGSLRVVLKELRPFVLNDAVVPEPYDAQVKRKIEQHDVVVFSKTYCPYCKAVKQVFQELAIPVEVVELDQLGEAGVRMQEALKSLTGQSTVPSVFIGGKHYGGNSDIQKMNNEGTLRNVLAGVRGFRVHDAPVRATDSFDVVVVGGGSAGISFAMAAAAKNARVALCDFVVPSSTGKAWGLGGTCVNVGCIPKILMHRAAQTGEELADAHSFGLPRLGLTHNWESLIGCIQNYIKELNSGNVDTLSDNNIAYFNAQTRFLSPNKLQLVSERSVREINAKTVVLACGKRPKLPNDVIGVEHSITSDDLFSLSYFPGKVLCYGGGYIALETAGFLRSLGAQVTVLHRSDLLKDFDRQMVQIVVERMKLMGIQFVGDARLVEISKVDEGAPPKLRVTIENLATGLSADDEFNTVLMAIGREARLDGMNVEEVGVKVARNGKIVVDELDRTTCPNIYAIGDIADSHPELASIASQSGRYLAERLFSDSTATIDHAHIPSVLFTPAEYAFVGLSEEEAIAKHGAANVSVHFQFYKTPQDNLSPSYLGRSCAKVVCHKIVDHGAPGYFCKVVDERVLGIHVVGPSAGEILQGFVLAMRVGLSKKDLDSFVGISGTFAHVFSKLTLSK